MAKEGVMAVEMIAGSSKHIWFGVHAPLPFQWCPCDCSGAAGIIHWFFPIGDREERRSRALDECAECGATWTCYDIGRGNVWLLPDEQDPRYRRSRG